MDELTVGNIVQMKKKHPCGSDLWEVTRVGMDIKLTCRGCDRKIMLSRVKFNKQMKSIVSKANIT